jgi:hypothetical protein
MYGNKPIINLLRDHYALPIPTRGCVGVLPHSRKYKKPLARTGTRGWISWYHPDSPLNRSQFRVLPRMRFVYPCPVSGTPAQSYADVNILRTGAQGPCSAANRAPDCTVEFLRDPQFGNLSHIMQCRQTLFGQLPSKHPAPALCSTTQQLTLPHHRCLKLVLAAISAHQTLCITGERFLNTS